MALIKCPECGKEISDTCDHCIHCGYKLNQKKVDNNVNQSINEKETTKNNIRDAISLLIVLVGGGLFIYIGILAMNDTETGPQSQIFGYLFTSLGAFVIIFTLIKMAIKNRRNR